MLTSGPLPTLPTLSLTQTSRDLRRVADLTPDALGRLLRLATVLKDESTDQDETLRGKVVACLSERHSARATASFAAATARLGGTPVEIPLAGTPMHTAEELADTARSLSAYVDVLVVRAFAQTTVDELARWASIPVVNALSDEHHPCQALADLLTIEEAFGDLERRHVTFVGDGGSNVAHSLLEAGALAGLDVTVACPPGFEPSQAVLAEAHRLSASSGARLQVVHDPCAAVAGAHAVYAGRWASTGNGANGGARRRALAPYQVTEELMSLAQPGAIFLHCLPATRGEEVAAEVIDGPQSAVWRQSANRLPIEQATLVMLTRAAGR